MRESYLKENVIPECVWHVIYLMRYAWFVNYLFLSWKFRFPEVFPTITDSKRSHGLLGVNVISVTVSHQNLTNHRLWHLAPSVLWTVSDLWDVSAYIKSTVLSVQEIRNSKKAMNGPQGTVASKTVKPVHLHLVEQGLNKLKINWAELNPTHKIESEVFLTLQVESQHFKHPSSAVLEYARDLGNTMHESLKRTSQWSAYYFTHRRSYYPLPENSISLRDIPKMSPTPPKDISQAVQSLMREWAQEHEKALRQRRGRQCTTKHNAGTLPLNLYEKEIIIAEWNVTFFYCYRHRCLSFDREVFWANW